MTVGSKIVAWLWVLLAILFLFAFVGLPCATNAICFIIFALGGFGLLCRRAFGWWTVVLVSGFLTSMMVIGLPFLVAGSTLTASYVLCLLATGAPFVILLRNRPRQWSVREAEEVALEQTEAQPDHVPQSPTVPVASSIPSSVPSRRKASSTHARMVHCPSCGYPNVQGRQTCYKCNVALPSPTTLQRLTETCISWNGVCLAMVVLAALIIHHFAGQGAGIQASVLPPPAQNNASPSVQQSQQQQSNSAGTARQACTTCGGSGVISCSPVCGTCGGDGKYHKQEMDEFISGTDPKGPCASCNGTGKCSLCGGSGSHQCSTCGGAGTAQAAQQVAAQSRVQASHADRMEKEMDQANLKSAKEKRIRLLDERAQAQQPKTVYTESQAQEVRAERQKTLARIDNELVQVEREISHLEARP